MRDERGPGQGGVEGAEDVRRRGQRDRLHLQLAPLQGQQEQLRQQGPTAAATTISATQLGSGISQICRGFLQEESW